MVLPLNAVRSRSSCDDVDHRRVVNGDGRSMKIVLICVYSTPAGRRRMKAGSPGAKVGWPGALAELTRLLSLAVPRGSGERHGVGIAVYGWM
jgi:hypothetical protein